MLARPVDLSTLNTPPPGSLAAWTKTLWFLYKTTIGGVAYLAYDYLQQINPAQGTDTGDLAHTWRRIDFHVHNTDSDLPADDQAFTLDIVNYTNGAVDNSWTTTDYQNVTSSLTPFIATVAATMPNYLTFTRWDAYVRAFNAYGTLGPNGKPQPYAPSGPPEHTSPMAIPGTGTIGACPQGCTTITEKTPSRKHWGRMYLPSLRLEEYTPTGRLFSTAVSALSGAYATMAEQLASQGFYPVVPTLQINGAEARTLQQVTACAVDDVTDVIRRRRYREPTNRVEHPTPGP